MLDGKTLGPDPIEFKVSEGKLRSGSDELAFTGTVPVGESWVKVNEEGRVAINIYDGKYFAVKDYDETGVTLTETEEAALTREELAQKLAELTNIVNQNNETLTNSIANLQTSNTSITASITDMQTTVNNHTTSINDINAKTNMTTYTSLEQLGLSSGCSLTDIITAMPKGSIALLAASSSIVIEDIPVAAGTLIIYKYDSNRISMNFYNRSFDFWYRIYYNNAFGSGWNLVSK